MLAAQLGGFLEHSHRVSVFKLPTVNETHVAQGVGQGQVNDLGLVQDGNSFCLRQQEQSSLNFMSLLERVKGLQIGSKIVLRHSKIIQDSRYLDVSIS